MRVAVIDIGTYSTRITIVEVEKNGFKILNEEGIIRLRKGW